MARLDRKYKKMNDGCERYQKEIERLKNLVYGYNTYLDYIVPYSSENFFEKASDCWGIKEFCNKMIEYFSSLTEETSAYFAGEKTEKDKNTLVNLTKCIIYILKTECEHEDYTFLGMITLLKTFIEEYPDDYAPTKDDSTFWHLVNNVIEKGGSTAFPEEIMNAFSDIYTDFDFYYTKRIAAALLRCVRFFLYDQRIDFISDRIMNLATMELVREIEDRLSAIYENRYPRKEDLH